MSLVVRKPAFCIYAKTKTQISFAVTAKLISVFVFATRIVQSLYSLNPKFQASSHLLWLYSLVCIGPGQKPRRRFSQDKAQILGKFLCHRIPFLGKWAVNVDTYQTPKTLPASDQGLHCALTEAFSQRY